MMGLGRFLFTFVIINEYIMEVEMTSCPNHVFKDKHWCQNCTNELDALM